MNIIKSIILRIWEWSHPLSKSTHYDEYVEIAEQYRISVRRVYKLAHGSRPKHYHEHLVLHDLSSRGIIKSK